MLLRLKETDRALVATILNGQLTVQSIHSLQPSELDNASPVATVLSQVKKQSKGLLVLDSEQETLLSGVPENRRQEMRSAVCVPVLSESDSPIAILYADSRAKVGSFSYADLNQLQADAQQLAPRIAALLAEQAQGKKAPSEEPVVSPKHLTVFLMLVLCAILWFMAGAFFSRKPDRPAQEPVVGVAQAAPPMVAASFIGMLGSGGLQDTYMLLSQRMQKKWPAERLQKQLAGWLANRDNRADLQYRTVRKGTGVAVGFGAQVLVDTQEPTQSPERRYNEQKDRWENFAVPRERKNYWTFHMVKEGQSWKIDRMQPGFPSKDGVVTPVPLPEEAGGSP